MDIQNFYSELKKKLIERSDVPTIQKKEIGWNSKI